ncbi:MAG: DNA-directed DNA polymerase [Nanoarchaeota archaeon]|nr:DNA-directed DNA polymerase [Nanoarchaeota archaeon]
MATLQFFPTDVTLRTVNDKSIISAYGRTLDGKQVCLLDEGFRPYLYVLPEPKAETEAVKNSILEARIEFKEEVISPTEVETVTKRLLGKELKLLKVYVTQPSHIATLQSHIKGIIGVKDCYEYDIPFARKWLIDNNVTPYGLSAFEGEFITQKSKIPVFRAVKLLASTEESYHEPKILSIRIETLDTGAISLIALKSDKYNKVLTWKTFDKPPDYVEFVDSEVALLEKLKETIEAQNPDVLAGYMSDSFDLPHIQARADKYKIHLELGLDFSSIRLKGDSASIVGIQHLDMHNFIDRFTSLEEDELELGAVGEQLLGLKQEPYSDSLPDLCAASAKNAGIIFQLAKLMMPQMIELMKLIGLPLFDVTRMGFSRLVEWYLLRMAPQFNEISPNRPSHAEVQVRRKATYAGGFVLKPEPGLYKDIMVFDFRSLYPSIISSHNIGPDTQRCSCCEKPGSEIWYCEKRKGFVSSVISDIITRRARIEKIMDKESVFLRARCESLKLLANSFYGYMGFFASRWYSLESAREVTRLGREYINKVIDQAKKDFKVIYGDTDSVFLLLGNKKRLDADRFAEKINLELPGIMELELEGYYPAGLFVEAKEGGFGAKKKYALLREDGTMKIRGFELVRRNFSDYAKRTQRELLEIILEHQDKDKALKHVLDRISRLVQHKVQVEELVIKTQLQKSIEAYETVGPHVAVAKLLKEKGVDVGPGTIISFVVVKGKELIRDRAKPPEDVGQDDYDSEYYIKNQVIPSVEKIMNLIGFKAEDLEPKEQSKLDRYIQTKT